jgi:hypothetical protein
MQIISKFISLFSVVLSIILISVSPVVALYNAPIESRFLFAGFIVVEKTDGSYGQCGINYISKTTGITAAHCLEGVTKVYAGSGNYDDNFKNKAILSTDFSISPDYSESNFAIYPGMGDVGVVKFDQPVSISQYATVTAPEAGCGYFLIGYGQNEVDKEFERRSVDVCLKNFTDYSFELEFNGNQHFCNGDSGSGIYKSGTNELVGTVSAFYTEYGELSCVGASAYIATRLDSNISFIQKNIPMNSYDIDKNQEIETLPDNYFEEYHPETKNPDGSGYNYNNDIEVQIEELSSMFDAIYPEENENKGADPYAPVDPYYDPNAREEDYKRELNEQLNFGSFMLGSIAFVWCMVCGIITLIVGGIIFLVIYLLKKKK